MVAEGRLREPLTSLRRADAIVLMRGASPEPRMTMRMGASATTGTDCLMMSKG